MSARKSWNLPPEDLLDQAYVPSLWRVQKTVLRVLLTIVLGALPLSAIIHAKRHVHQQLANAPRRRTPCMSYPVKQLF